MRQPVAVLVLGLHPVRIGGIEMQTREVARELGKAGWRVVLCYLSAPAPVVRNYFDLPNIVWDELPNAWKNNFTVFRNLHAIIRRHRPDILHLQFTPFLSFYPLLARLYGVGGIYFTNHGSHPEQSVPCRASFLRRLLGRLLTAHYHSVICVSQFNARMLQTAGTIEARKLVQIYNATDVSAPPDASRGVAFRLEHNIPREAIVVAQISWLIPQKGVSDTLEAAAIAIGQCPRLHFAIVGAGEEMEELRRLADSLSIAGHIHWLGQIDDPMRAGVFAAADIACQTSRWEEAFGFAIAEAMACSKPVIATRVGGVPEVVADGVSGFLVPSRNPRELAGKILELAANPAMRSAFGAAGRRRAEERFDVRQNVRSLLSLYFARQRLGAKCAGDSVLAKVPDA